MNIVIVKHENCGTKYIFLVPENKILKAGDLVMVESKHGEVIATCLSDSFVVNEIGAKRVFNAFGIDKPTAYVVGKFTYDKWERI